MRVKNGDVISKEYKFKHIWGICYIINIQYKKDSKWILVGHHMQYHFVLIHKQLYEAYCFLLLK